MADASFVVSNGSIVIFDHQEGTGKINNHRPHPEITTGPGDL